MFSKEASKGHERDIEGNQTNSADLTIKGSIGSAAEAYANYYGYTFVQE